MIIIVFIFIRPSTDHMLLPHPWIGYNPIINTGFFVHLYVQQNLEIEKFSLQLYHRCLCSTNNLYVQQKILSATLSNNNLVCALKNLEIETISFISLGNSIIGVGCLVRSSTPPQHKKLSNVEKPDSC